MKLPSSPIPEFAPAFVRAADLEGFVRVISRCPSLSDRKRLVIDAHCFGGLTEVDCGILIQALHLEEA